MAQSDVSICNLALSRIGHTDFIADLVNDTSAEAEACRQAYGPARDEVLESAPWPFATRRARPAPLDGTALDNGSVPTGWTYAYALPADIIGPSGIRSIWPGVRNPRVSDEIPFAISYDGNSDQTIVLTDEQSPELIYTVAVTNAARFSAKFGSAVAFRLAAELALSIKKDAKLAQLMAQAYQQALAEAFAFARTGTKPDVEPDPDFIAARS